MNAQRKPLERCPARQQLHAEVNKQEDYLRDIAFSEGNLDALSFHGDLNAARVFADFVHDRKQLNSMTDRFRLLTENEKYAGIVTSVELGMTTSADSIDELDGLKSNYRDLLGWLVDENYSTGEIPREESKRTFEINRSAATKEYVVIARNRQLALGRIALDVPLDFEISKRMVFEMPSGVLYAIQKRAGDETLATDDTKKLIERQLDSNNPLIYPIRTAYHATARQAF